MSTQVISVIVLIAATNFITWAFTHHVMQERVKSFEEWMEFWMKQSFELDHQYNKLFSSLEKKSERRLLSENK